MLRSLINREGRLARRRIRAKTDEPGRRVDEEGRACKGEGDGDHGQNRDPAEAQRRPRSTLIPELLPLVLPFADQSTLCTLARVDRYTYRLASPLINNEAALHTPSAILSFFQRPVTGTRPAVPGSKADAKVKHIDLHLDVSFWLNINFRRITLDHRWSTPSSRALTSQVETLYLTTSGKADIPIETDKRFRSSVDAYHLVTLVQTWLRRLAPARGPKHFYWRHVDLSLSLSQSPTSPPDDPQARAGPPTDRPRRWPEIPLPAGPYWFAFLSDYTAVDTLRLPRVAEPID
ncbi:hypothetical protein IAU60_005269 [Kwoniella sp. DSM 27419]